jgi:hypothetical protein
VLGWLGFAALFMGLSTYMHAFAWSAGIDAQLVGSPEVRERWVLTAPV